MLQKQTTWKQQVEHSISVSQLKYRISSTMGCFITTFKYGKLSTDIVVYLSLNFKTKILRNLWLSVGRTNYSRVNYERIHSEQAIPSLVTRFNKIKKETEAWKRVLINMHSKQRLGDCWDWNDNNI